jgi:hypothetical protein
LDGPVKHVTYHRIHAGQGGGSVKGVRRVLRLFSPPWLLRHLLAAGLIGFFVYMGRWQWTKGESSHGTLQNLFYGIEWWIFTAFVLYLWGKMIVEEFRPSQPAGASAGLAPSAGPETPVPAGAALPDGWSEVTSAVARADAPLVYAAVAVPASLATTPPDEEDPEDEELAAYNRYLATLRSRGSA